MLFDHLSSRLRAEIIWNDASAQPFSGGIHKKLFSFCEFSATNFSDEFCCFQDTTCFRIIYLLHIYSAQLGKLALRPTPAS